MIFSECQRIPALLGGANVLMCMLHGPIVCVELFCWYSPLLVRYVIGVGCGLCVFQWYWEVSMEYVFGRREVSPEDKTNFI